MRFESTKLVEALIKTLTDDIEAIEEQIRESRTKEPSMVPTLESAQKRLIKAREGIVSAWNLLLEN
jgi:hypothetical protein